MRDCRPFPPTPEDRRTARRPALVLALLAGMMTAAMPGAVLGQQSGTTQPSASVTIDDATLDTFARASIKIDALSQKWQPQIASAETPAEQQNLRRQAIGEMERAVQAEGMTVAAYNEIVEAARSDEALAQRIEQRRQAVR